MRVPDAPGVTPLQHLSPSVYEALFRCRALAAWAAFGDRGTLPQHPKAFLGVCLHGVVEDAHNGRLAGSDGEGRPAAARNLFDERARFLYDHAHPLIRVKFSSPERLPYYNLFRERAALEAAASAERIERGVPSANATQPAPELRLYAEKKLLSRDGLLVGRPDLIDAVAQEVVDYKTGAPQDEAVDAVSEAEARQLRLYVHLAQDNGLPVSRAVVARPDGRCASIDVSREEANAEGRRARDLLAKYNSGAGVAFSEAAQPSPESCRFCPCIPLCEAFWRAASPTWEDQCGVQLEGHVAAVEESTVQGMKLMTLRVQVQRGTVAAGEAFVEQIPEAWTTADGSNPPREGAVVRIVHARRAGDDVPPVIRVDRTATSVWTGAAEGQR
jgi:hypothetical protein